MKKRIKHYIPDIVIYYYKILQKMPEYLKSLKAGGKITYPNINFYTDKEVIDRIVNQRMSLSRFGDGELMWMTGKRLDSFQDYSDQLSKALIDAFTTDCPKLLIGIPIGIQNTKHMNLYAKMHWRIVKQDFFGRLLQFIDVNRKYANASITRPYIDYRGRKFSNRAFHNIRKIWNGRDIVFVEGAQTKLGMGNDLFDNAKSCRRIICPATNAFGKYDEIKKAIHDKVSKDDLILVALGPTASILSADLCKEGYQVVDTGHIDIEYMWYLKHSVLRDALEGKYVNESGQKGCSDLYDQDPQYLKSIIARI